MEPAVKLVKQSYDFQEINPVFYLHSAAFLRHPNLVSARDSFIRSCVLVTALLLPSKQLMMKTAALGSCEKMWSLDNVVQVPVSQLLLNSLCRSVLQYDTIYCIQGTLSLGMNSHKTVKFLFVNIEYDTWPFESSCLQISECSSLL